MILIMSAGQKQPTTNILGYIGEQTNEIKGFNSIKIEMLIKKTKVVVSKIAQ